MRTKLEAALAGKKLRKKLRGRGWRINIWEDLGWHCVARNKNVIVHTTHAFYFSPYWAEVEEFTSDYVYFCDPNKAAQHAIACARKKVTQLGETVQRAEKIYAD